MFKSVEKAIVLVLIVTGSGMFISQVFFRTPEPQYKSIAEIIESITEDINHGEKQTGSEAEQ